MSLRSKSRVCSRKHPIGRMRHFGRDSVFHRGAMESFSITLMFLFYSMGVVVWAVEFRLKGRVYSRKHPIEQMRHFGRDGLKFIRTYSFD